MVKICKKCRQAKSLDDFHNNPVSKDGRHCYCKVCAIKGAKKYYKENREEILPSMTAFNMRRCEQVKAAINYFKSQWKCCVCQENESVCLDFHHPDKTQKERNVSYFASVKNIESIVQEINKCVCVCANCHRKIHANLINVADNNLVSVTVEQFLEKFNAIKETTPDIGKRKRYKADPKTCQDCGKEVWKGATRCRNCAGKLVPHKVPHPTKEELFKLLWEIPTLHIAKTYGVSHTTIAKWCKSYGLQKPPRGYWAKQKS